MPLIDIQVLEGVFSAEEKAQMIAKVTEAFAEVAGGRMKQATSVRIHEIRSGDWGYAGVPLTTADALAMRRAE
ncbi:tautomerase family protein [Salipiger mucosus]|uniref:4-oxalocrotonate tautomerase n=1 Tax=Salipiger mucosus DSM 16094 TaxID=1123237 RepID=S9QLK7_9RHOB|nr:tautomerase family protein [Salipiger mucosus]EPX80483.1 4-oxalocrotonate tautomerase [Salipiger mucosus DSM 16094]